MDIHQLVFLLIVAALSGLAGFRSEKSGWILIAVFPVLIWVIVFATLVGEWCLQIPASAFTFNFFYFLTAHCLSFWIGQRAANPSLSG